MKIVQTTIDEIEQRLGILEDQIENLMKIIEQEATMKIIDSVRVLDLGYEFDDDSWKSNQLSAVRLLNSIGLKGEEILSDIRDEENADGDDIDDEDSE